MAGNDTPITVFTSEGSPLEGLDAAQASRRMRVVSVPRDSMRRSPTADAPSDTPRPPDPDVLNLRSVPIPDDPGVLSFLPHLDTISSHGIALEGAEISIRDVMAAGSDRINNVVGGRVQTLIVHSRTLDENSLMQLTEILGELEDRVDQIVVWNTDDLETSAG